ncbi:Uncharacterised protein [Acinetobacter baumannii]|nr:Uncharacterised protein [Acinetobacter baumannii]
MTINALSRRSRVNSLPAIASRRAFSWASSHSLVTFCWTSAGLPDALLAELAPNGHHQGLAAFGSAAAATSFFAAAISAFCSAALAATSRPPSSLPNGHHQWLEPTCSASAFCSVACLATVCPSSLPNGHHEWLEACSAGALAGCEEASWVWK